MKSASRWLTPRQYRGLERLGDAYCPGDDALPAFSALGCGEHVDRVLEYMPEADRNSLKGLLAACSWLPSRLLRVGLDLLERFAPRAPWPMGGGLRFLQMGVKGLVMTLYYSGSCGREYRGATPYDVLEYHVGVYTGDLPVREG